MPTHYIKRGGRFVAVHSAKKKSANKKKVRKGKSLFAVAAANKQFKSAKSAAKKAARKSTLAWKAALRKAKKTVKYC